MGVLGEEAAEGEGDRAGGRGVGEPLQGELRVGGEVALGLDGGEQLSEEGLDRGREVVAALEEGLPGLVEVGRPHRSHPRQLLGEGRGFIILPLVQPENPPQEDPTQQFLLQHSQHRIEIPPHDGDIVNRDCAVENPHQ